MGDISEMRGVIVLFTVVSLTVGLIMLMPSNYFTASTTAPSTYNNTVTGILAWNSSYTLNVTKGTVQTFSLNGYGWYMDTAILTDTMRLGTYSNWFIFNYDFDWIRWINTTGYDWSETDAFGDPQLNFADLDTASVEQPYTFDAKNSRTNIRVTMVYNDTAYSTWSDALNADAITLIFSIDLDDRNTSMNALGIVGLVLTAQLPNIHPVVNGVFALIGWGFVGASVYLVFIFVLRIVGAVFGGGGA